jgi:hypothetical protein
MAPMPKSIAIKLVGILGTPLLDPLYKVPGP